MSGPLQGTWDRSEGAGQISGTLISDLSGPDPKRMCLCLRGPLRVPLKWNQCAHPPDSFCDSGHMVTPLWAVVKWGDGLGWDLEGVGGSRASHFQGWSRGVSRVLDVKVLFQSLQLKVCCFCCQWWPAAPSQGGHKFWVQLQCPNPSSRND